MATTVALPAILISGVARLRRFVCGSTFGTIYSKGRSTITFVQGDCANYSRTRVTSQCERGIESRRGTRQWSRQDALIDQTRAMRRLRTRYDGRTDIHELAPNLRMDVDLLATLHCRMFWGGS